MDTHLQVEHIYPQQKWVNPQGESELKTNTYLQLNFYLKMMDALNNHIIATIKIELTHKLLKVIKTSLSPETETQFSDRSQTSLVVNENQLIIKTKASDIIALRASLNSYLRWIDGIQKIIENIS